MEDANLYRSIYQYNDAIGTQYSNEDGLSYSELTEKYFEQDLSKEDIFGGSIAPQSLPASHYGYTNLSTYDTPSKTDTDAKTAEKLSEHSQPTSKTPYVNLDVDDDPYSSDRDSLDKTLSKLKNKAIGNHELYENNENGSYENVPNQATSSGVNSDSAYTDESSYTTSYASSRKYSGSGSYYGQSNNQGSYENVGNSNQSTNPGDDGYERGTFNYNSPRSNPRLSTGSYENVNDSANDPGEGFRGLRNTQKRLEHYQRQMQNAPQLPLYVESQKTDFYKSFSWNERWQALLERPTMTPEEVRQRGEDINQLTEEFLQVARPIVSKIVEELHLPDEQKTFKPVDVGGIAGGEKFMAKQLFLKYARDHIKLRLYNGDAWAQKAAIHELKSLNALIACNIPNLHFPLMACLSCYGHYIVVVSKLPLSKNTLVYGSADVAKTIKTDRDMAHLFKQAAEKLNLKAHVVVEGSTKNEKTLYGPVDIEGHKGMDGRSYIVDTARLFPPAPPIRGIRGCHLYKLLRKELVRTNPTPLSSDAFSFFGKVNSEENNLEVKNATNRIFTELIPRLLNLEDINHRLCNTSITDLVHEFGINVRFLGCILADAVQLPHISKDSITSIVLEMVARASKSVFFHSMRSEIDETIPKALECRRIAAEHWNNLLFNPLVSNNMNIDGTSAPTSEECLEWWSSVLIPALKQRFIFFKGDPEWVVPLVEQLEESANQILVPSLFDNVRSCPLKLFERTIQLSGVVFSDELIAASKQNGDQFFFTNTRQLTMNDVIEIKILDKRVQFVPFADLKGEGKFEEAKKFYMNELANRVRALGSEHPQVALTYRHLGELYSDQKGYEEAAKEAYQKAATIIKNYYKSDVNMQLRDMTDILSLHADLYIKYDRLLNAETILRELLDLYRPNNASKDLSTSASSKRQSVSIDLSFISQLDDNDKKAETAPILDKLAKVQAKLGKYSEAEHLYIQARKLKEQVFGSDHWQVARTLNGHAQLLFAQNRLSEAKGMCFQVKAITEASRGLYHSEVGIALDNLARVHSAEGKFEIADAMLQKALEIKKKSLGESHSFVAMTWDHMASNRFQHLLQNEKERISATRQAGEGKYEVPSSTIDQLSDIKTLYLQALLAIEQSLGKTHSAYAITKSNLAVVLAYLADWNKARKYAKEALQILTQTLGEHHSSVTVAKSNLQYIESLIQKHNLVTNDDDDVESKETGDKTFIEIQPDSLKMVYHAQYISSSAPERSRIPDKIKLLLEKKGMAVTEANAQKVAELLKQKQRQQQLLQQQQQQTSYYAEMPDIKRDVEPEQQKVRAAITRKRLSSAVAYENVETLNEKLKLADDLEVKKAASDSSEDEEEEVITEENAQAEPFLQEFSFLQMESGSKKQKTSGFNLGKMFSCFKKEEDTRLKPSKRALAAAPMSLDLSSSSESSERSRQKGSRRTSQMSSYKARNVKLDRRGMDESQSQPQANYAAPPPSGQAVPSSSMIDSKKGDHEGKITRSKEQDELFTSNDDEFASIAPPALIAPPKPISALKDRTSSSMMVSSPAPPPPPPTDAPNPGFASFPAPSAGAAPVVPIPFAAPPPIVPVSVPAPIAPIAPISVSAPIASTSTPEIATISVPAPIATISVPAPTAPISPPTTASITPTPVGDIEVSTASKRPGPRKAITSANTIQRSPEESYQAAPKRPSIAKPITSPSARTEDSVKQPKILPPNQKKEKEKKDSKKKKQARMPEEDIYIGGQVMPAPQFSSSSAAKQQLYGSVDDEDIPEPIPSSGGWGSYMAADDQMNDLAADNLLEEINDIDLDDLDGLDLSEEIGTPAPHTGPNWGWSGI